VEALEDRSVPANFYPATAPQLVASLVAANQTPEADIISLSPGATYRLTKVDNSIHGATGLPAIGAGEPLTILGNGATIERSPAAKTPSFRLLAVSAGGSLTVEDLTLQGGRANGSGVTAQGGGVFNQGSLTLRDVVVQNNRVEGSLSATAVGGGIYSAGALVIEGGIVRNNLAWGGAGRTFRFGPLPGAPGQGGGVYVAGGTAELTGVDLVANSALGGTNPSGSLITGSGRGGGLYAAGGAISLHGCSVTENKALGNSYGGGLYIEADAAVTLDTFTNLHVTDNSASHDPNISIGS
jgi:hypothetical protein